MIDKQEIDALHNVARTMKEEGLSLEEALDLLPENMRISMDREVMAVRQAANLGLDAPDFASRRVLIVIYAFMGWKPKDPFDRIVHDALERKD